MSVAKKDQKILLAVDGNALLHRAWHALPPLTDRRGRVVNAVYGFLTILFKAVRDYAPAYLAVTFDRPGKTFRHNAYEQYKATRVKQPDELYAQIPILEEVLRAFGVPIFSVEVFEADDALGTIAELAKNDPGVLTCILTGDLDTLQLVDDQTRIITLRKGITDVVPYDAAAVRERFGLAPEQMIDYKALRGDASDNIKGVPGVGEKTAAELLQKFGTLEKMFASFKKNRFEGFRETLAQKIIAAEAEAALAKDLVTIRRDLPLDFSLRRAALVKAPRERIVELLGELGFRSLIDRIPEAMVDGFSVAVPTVEKSSKTRPVKTKVEPKLWVITEAVEAAAWAKKFAAKELVFIAYPEPAVALFAADEIVFVHGVFATRALKPVLENEKIRKFTFDYKAAEKILSMQGIVAAGVVFDAMLADYLLSPGTRSHGLAALALAHLKRELPSTAQGTLLAKNPAELAKDAVAEIKALAALRPILESELDARNQTFLLAEMELPLAKILAAMERIGVKIDASLLHKMSREFGKKLEELTHEIWELGGGEFNIASPQQLKAVLFDKLRIPTERIKKTMTGSGFSTAAAELEKLRELHPIVPKIMEYRELAKLKGTYVDALPELVSVATGRVHTSYNQTVTATGRISSSDPNLQNIPIRTELGRAIRKAFIADKDNVLVAADYSQIELRLVAAIAGSKAMIASFKNNEDIHARTAALIWGIRLDKVTSEQRRAAKAINFGVVYGIGPQGLAQGAGISFNEAREFIQKYFESNPEVREYIDLTKALAHKQGYVETVFGRRRYLPEIESGVRELRAAAERMAINHPVQGTAADILKLAMIRVATALEKQFPAARLIMTVHDEIVVEAPEKEARAVAKLLKAEMEGAHRFSVPIVVDVESGKNWGEMEKI